MLIVAAAGALLGLNLLLARWAVPTGPAEDPLSRTASLVAGAWVVLALLPVHDLSPRPAAAAVTGLDPQTAIELAAFAAAGVLAVHLLRSVVPSVPIGTGLLVLPVWVLASATWGATGPYAIARGLEYVALAALALATAGLAGVRPDLVDVVAERFLRWTVRATLALIALGVALGPLSVRVTAPNADRFTWLGAHPTESGFVLGVAFLVLIGVPGAVLQMSAPVRVVALAVVGVALVENQSRTVLAGIAVGIVVLLWLWRRTEPDRTAAAGFALGAGTVAAVLLAGGGLWSYVLRDEGTERLTTLNGRTDLWDIGLRALETPAQWLHGLGFGATRTLFLDEADFAGDAHNSLLGTLVSLGVVGVVLLSLALWRVGVDLHRSDATSTPLGRAVAVLVAYAVVSATTKDSLAEPHFALTSLYLAGGLAAGWLLARPRAQDHVAAPAQRPALATRPPEAP